MTGFKQYRDRLERLEKLAAQRAAQWTIRRIIITADCKQVEVIERAGNQALLLVSGAFPPGHEYFVGPLPEPQA
jgi:hypothetical protein